jgi:Flp pilus assembly protein TadD
MTLVNAAIHVALARHRAGNPAAAEVECRALPGHKPQHADAMHLPGVLLQGKGDFIEAQSLIAGAAPALGRSPDVLSNLAMASLPVGQPEDAHPAQHAILCRSHAPWPVPDLKIQPAKASMP